MTETAKCNCSETLRDLGKLIVSYKKLFIRQLIRNELIE